MSRFTSVPLDEIQARGSIRDGDVARLRQAFLESPAIGTADAEALLALDAACPVKDAGWARFLIDTVTDCIVMQMRPEGYMDADKAGWLTAQLAAHGQIGTRIGIELVATVMECARWSPASLVCFALVQVRKAVATGAGPLRAGAAGGASGVILASDIDALTRLLIAYGGETGVAVTAAEADQLIEIERAIAPGNSSPAWSEFLVKVVGNAVLAGIGHQVANRTETLTTGAWLADGGVDPGRSPGAAVAHLKRASASFAGRMIAGGAGSIWSSCRLLSSEERALLRLERQRREIITGEPIGDADEAWLLARLGRDGRFTENETALLAFLQREAARLPAAINTLAARATIAA